MTTMPKQSPAPGTPERPDWVDETPDECDYRLLMYDSGGGAVQEIVVTRAEYLALKQHLAEMRGLAPAEDEEEDEPGETPAAETPAVEPEPEGFDKTTMDDLREDIDSITQLPKRWTELKCGATLDAMIAEHHWFAFIVYMCVGLHSGFRHGHNGPLVPQDVISVAQRIQKWHEAVGVRS